MKVLFLHFCIAITAGGTRLLVTFVVIEEILDIVFLVCFEFFRVIESNLTLFDEFLSFFFF